MTRRQIKDFLRTNPGYLKWGSLKLAAKLDAPVNRVKQCAKEVRKELSYPKEKKDSLNNPDENLVLRSRWFNGKEWCESYRNVDLPLDLLTKEDWLDVFSSVGKIEPIYAIEEPKKTNERTLVIWTSDKHIGAAIPSDALYKRQYNQHIFHERMIQIFNEAIRYFHTYGAFDELIIADLGDSLDGFDALTTRGGHKLPQNLNNKEAARVHFFTHKWFYDSLVKSGMAKNIKVVNITNDNHAGDFGYQCNFALTQYGTLAWPDIEFINIEEFIGHIEIYERAYLLTHGKDKKNRSRPLPLKINAETESFLMDYVLDRGLGNKKVHVRKGDIHLNDLDSSRKKLSYWNIGSVFGSSDWIMDNFSDTVPSCVFEIIEKGVNHLESKILWLE
jgi:hypothetical protein